MTDINVNVTGGTLPQQEIDAYIAHGKEKYHGKKLRLWILRLTVNM